MHSQVSWRLQKSNGYPQLAHKVPYRRRNSMAVGTHSRCVGEWPDVFRSPDARQAYKLQRWDCWHSQVCGSIAAVCCDCCVCPRNREPKSRAELFLAVGFGSLVEEEEDSQCFAFVLCHLE